MHAQGKAPRFEVDPSWPKPLPNLWVTGGMGGVCIDSRDHVFILNRGDLTDNDLDAGHQAPAVIEFDPEGNVVNSFGDPETTPNTPHGCTVDSENSFWMTGTGEASCRNIRTTEANFCSKSVSEAWLILLTAPPKGKP